MKFRRSMNWNRYLWLALRHHERAYWRWARCGRYTLCEMARSSANHYRAKLGLAEMADD